MSELAVGQWQAAAGELAGQSLAQLIALQPAADQPVELWLRTGAGEVRFTRLATDQAPSLAGIWPLAAMFEQRIAADFGLTFTAAAVPVGAGLLRKSVLSKSRQQTPWPGRKDPTDRAGAPSRRRQLPLGVVEQVNDDMELR